MANRPPSPTTKRLALAVGLTAAFAVSAYIGLKLIVKDDGAAPIWMANGFLAAALLLLPRRWGAAVAATCYGLQVTLGFLRGDPTILAFSLSAVNVLESLIVVVLARRVCGPGVRLTNLRRVARLVGFAIVPANLISATAATAILFSVAGAPVKLTWTSWFVSDALGMTLVLPAVLLARSHSRYFQRSIAEQVAIFAVLIAFTAAAFMVKGVPIHFLLFPAALMAAFRLGPRGTGYAMLLLTAMTVGVIGLHLGGPVNPDWSMAERVRAGQVMVATIFATSLTTALAVSDQLRLRRLWAHRSALARRAQARAEAAGRAKAEFLATMSHEIRTPMNSILGFTDMLRRRDDLPDDAMRRLQLIDQAGASLLAVVNDILDFSKMDAGEIELTPEACAPRDVVHSAMAIVTDAAAAKGLKAVIDLSGDVDSPVLIDDLRVRQILLNLLGNAIKFTAEGEVRLALQVAETGPDARRLRFSVTDTGVGVSPEKHDRLFKRFSQADSSVSRAFGGTGLGLAICKGLVDRMGGDIGVESEPGRGACFWVEIPAALAEGEMQPAAEIQGADIAGLRVLLVDDHPMNRELGAMILGVLECEVALAESGEEAIRLAGREAFDVILMDLHMPRMDGWEAARAIQALGGEAARTPIIALSADVMPEAADQCRRAGMVDIAAKPIRVEALHDVLSRWAGLTPNGEARIAAAA